MIKSYQDGPVHFVLLTTCYVIKAIVRDVDIIMVYSPTGIYSELGKYRKQVTHMHVIDHNYTTQLRPFSIVYIVSRQLMFE